ncbi:heat shock protein Hsp-16.1/Hsp-16.11 [Ixodes scapularis]|uniref:heat shock protein Hsp-16.1/Hsp-16.11 n=1 Tax=Ixodes scapularis TaxID=6945 RepID=UPI001C3901F9|nr:heat shock protein Hsp-16.1/Hsp-16.11 [Ixodes scapularis]
MMANVCARTTPLARRVLLMCPRRSIWRRYPVPRSVSDVFNEFDHQLRSMERDMSRAFRDLDSHGYFGPTFRWLRTRDVPVETGSAEKFQLQLDVAQFKPEDVKVSLSGNQLTVRARAETKEGDSSYVREFSHSVTLPEDVDPDTVRSVLQADGSLSIEAPRLRLEQAREPKEVPIERADPDKQASQK